MGLARKQRKKYDTPSHPWQKGRLDEEAVTFKEYALKNKKEIWKMKSKLAHFTRQAKSLGATERDQQQGQLMITSMKRLGLIKEGATVDAVLGLGVKDIMERRLQTMVFRKGLARTMKQARQFIVHKHVTVNGKMVTVPSYLVGANEEATISIIAESSLANPEHPERVARAPKKERKVIEKRTKQRKAERR